MDQAVDLVIKGGFTITMDEQRRVFQDGFVAVNAGKIVAVGSNRDCTFTGKAEIDARDHIVMPGLVNAHTHLVQSLLRGLSDEIELGLWVSELLFPSSRYLSAERAYAGARLSLLELTRSGVTTTADSHFTHYHKDSMDSVCQAVHESGLRGVLSRAAIDAETIGRPYRESVAEAADGVTRLQKRWNSDRIQIVPEALGILRCSREMIVSLYELAETTDTMFHMHLASSRTELETVQREHGCGGAQYLDSLGVLNERVLAAHCLWLKPDEISLLGNRQVKISHNPVSNMYLGSGFFPLDPLQSAGVTIGLGVDGAASNNSQNMFEAMKMAALLQKLKALDPTPSSAEEALELATIGSAQALGLGKEIGSLEKGKRADLILIAARRPHLMPDARLVSNLVYAGQAADVRTVLVGGEAILRDGKHTRWDEDEVIEEAIQAQRGLLKEAGSTLRIAQSTWSLL